VANIDNEDGTITIDMGVAEARFRVRIWDTDAGSFSFISYLTTNGNGELILDIDDYFDYLDEGYGDGTPPDFAVKISIAESTTGFGTPSALSVQ